MILIDKIKILLKMIKMTLIKNNDLRVKLVQSIRVKLSLLWMDPKSDITWKYEFKISVLPYAYYTYLPDFMFWLFLLLYTYFMSYILESL